MDFDYSIADLLAAAPPRGPRIPLWAMELAANLFLYAWLFCVGACVGSFLNVVVYRLPRGKNLAHPGSFCPRCRRPIRLWDNIPLVSWLVLRGRCRDCQSPIPVRYFLVELAVATLFLVVALIETKLPGGFPRQYSTLRLLTPYDTLPFWSAYTMHVVLLTTLLGAALIDASGHRTPWKLFLPAMLFGMAIPAIWPAIRMHSTIHFANAHLASLAEGVVALLVGWLVGGTLPLVWRFWDGHGEWPRFAPAALFAAIGAAAGIGRVVEIAVLTLLLFVAALAVLARRRSSVLVPLAGIAFLVTLPWLVSLDLRLTGSARTLLASPLSFAAAVTVIAGCAQLAPLIAPRQYFDAHPEDPADVLLPADEEPQQAEDAQPGVLVHAESTTSPDREPAP